jgi:ABC-type Fe3+-hydroxamate transport system substrate-binding protein
VNVKIELNEQGNGCKVWLNDTAVAFGNEEEAQAYVAQLQGRLEAAPGSFAPGDPAGEGA